MEAMAVSTVADTLVADTLVADTLGAATSAVATSAAGSGVMAAIGAAAASAMGSALAGRPILITMAATMPTLIGGIRPILTLTTIRRYLTLITTTAIEAPMRKALKVPSLLICGAMMGAPAAFAQEAGAGAYAAGSATP